MAVLDSSIITNLENQCKALPPGVEVEVQKKVTKKELEELMKKVGCEVDIHKWKVYILKPNKCLRQAETYGLSAEDVRNDCDIIDMEYYKKLLTLKTALNRYLRQLNVWKRQIKYYTEQLNNLKHRLKQAKEDLVKIKKDMDTFKWTSYYHKVYNQYVNITSRIKKTKEGLFKIQKNLDKRRNLRQKNLWYYNELMQKGKKYIDELNKYHTE